MTKGRIAVEVDHYYDAAPQDVWRVYTDHARWSEWAGTPNSHIVREGGGGGEGASKGEGDPNGVGCVRGFAGGTHEEILSFDPPKHMTYTVTQGIMPMKNHFGEVWLDAEGAGTRLRWQCHFDSKIPGLGGLLRIMITRVFRKALEGLEARGFD